MGKLIATAQATLDGVIDPVGEWVQPDGRPRRLLVRAAGRDRAGWCWVERPIEGLAGYWPGQIRSVGRTWSTRCPSTSGPTPCPAILEWNATLLDGDLEDSIPELKDEVDGDLFLHGSGEFAYALAERELIDEYEIYVNPLVWGRGNVHVLGDRGTVRMALHDVQRFDSGVVLPHLSPAILTDREARRGGVVETVGRRACPECGL